MHLIEKYSLNCGISPKKLGKPYIYTSYYPIQFDKYIVIHASSGMNAKNYSYYQDVIDFVFEKVNAAGYGIVQIGGQGDPKLGNCLNLQGITNIHQTAFILKNASLLIANDSFSTHMCSSFGIPCVSLYSVIQPEVAGPYWNNGKQFTIMAPLNGKKPKYSNEDPEMVINRIKPEQIIKEINSALPDLKLSSELEIESLFFGKNYSKIAIEFVPDQLISIQDLKETPLNIRFDYLISGEIKQENINSAIMNLSIRKCSVITSMPFDLDQLNNLKQNVSSLILHIEKKHLSKIDEAIKFIEKAVKDGFNVAVALIKNDFSEQEINDLKFKFLDIKNINMLDQTSWSKNLSEDSFSKINDLTIMKSSRIIISNGSKFLTKVALLENKPCSAIEQKISEINDKESLGKELENCYIYNP
jgi:hypothetical protein